MKVKRTEIKTARTAYLYQDGHLVLVHEKRDKDAGRIEWVTVYKDVGIKCYFTGRLVIGDGALPFLLHATRIRASEPDVSHGSDNTKNKHIRVGNVSLFNAMSNEFAGFHISLFPDLISGPFTYQPENKTTFEDVLANEYNWGSYHIKNIYQ